MPLYHPGMTVPKLQRLSSRLKLRHFALLAEIDGQRSISRAAERLDLAQPTVTRALSEIEQIFMTPLFVRSRKGLEPTPAGEVVLARARLALANAAALEQDLAALASGFQGTLRIGVIPFLSNHAHDALWGLLLELAPPVRCVLEESTTDRLLEGVRDGRLDCAICRFSSAGQGEGVVQQRLYQQEPRLLVSGAAAGRLARRGLDWAAFASMRWILPPRHTPIGEMIQSIFASAAQPMPAPMLEAYAQKTLASVFRVLPDAITILPDDVAQEVAQASGARVLPQRLQWHLPPVGMVRREAVPNAVLIDRIAQVLRGAAGANRRAGAGG
jgi:DNA-binding transcriptional LysR family regulator